MTLPSTRDALAAADRPAPADSGHKWTAALEHELARRLGVQEAVAFRFARHALIGLLEAVGAGDGDEVVLSPLNCKVVPLALQALGVKPVYADITADTLNLDPKGVAAMIGPRTRAILFQHTYGSPAGIEDVAAVASARQVVLIEDCAHCLPTASDSPSPGRSGLASIFSNNLRKPLPAGSGGFAATDDRALALRLRAKRDVSPSPPRSAELLLRAEMVIHRLVVRPRLYWPLFELSRWLTPYYRSRPVAAEIAAEIVDRAQQISEYQARAGLAAMQRIDEDARHRRQRCLDYVEALRGWNGLELPRADGSRPLYFFPVLVGDKDGLLRRARRRFIEMVAWPLRAPIYPVIDVRDLGAYHYEPGSCPVAEDVAGRIVGLPTDPHTGARERDLVVGVLRDHLKAR
jgi:perosamine synthetase